MVKDGRNPIGVSTTNCGWRTNTPQDPNNASRRKPGAGVEWLVEQHDQLLAQARGLGWQIEDHGGFPGYHSREVKQIQFYREGCELPHGLQPPL